MRVGTNMFKIIGANGTPRLNTTFQTHRMSDGSSPKTIRLRHQAECNGSFGPAATATAAIR